MVGTRRKRASLLFCCTTSYLEKRNHRNKSVSFLRGALPNPKKWCRSLEVGSVIRPTRPMASLGNDWRGRAWSAPTRGHRILGGVASRETAVRISEDGYLRCMSPLNRVRGAANRVSTDDAREPSFEISTTSLILFFQLWVVVVGSGGGAKFSTKNRHLLMITPIVRTT